MGLIWVQVNYSRGVLTHSPTLVVRAVHDENAIDEARRNAASVHLRALRSEGINPSWQGRCFNPPRPCQIESVESFLGEEVGGSHLERRLEYKRGAHTEWLLCARHVCILPAVKVALCSDVQIPEAVTWMDGRAWESARTS